MGYVKGQPRRFILGHGNRKHSPVPPDLDKRGLCFCGCGQATPLAQWQQPANGLYKGYPLRYVWGHNGRKAVHYLVEDRGYETPCWVWQLSINHRGYGLYRPPGGRSQPAHCWYYRQAKGPIPRGYEVDHLCRVRACVNPDHLEAVTPVENKRRSRSTKLTRERVEEIRELAAAKVPYRLISERFGISRGHVSYVGTGHGWQ